MAVEPAAVLVTDGEQRSSLAVVRSLGRAGYRPFVCSSTSTSLAGASRHAREHARVPPPAEDPDAYVDAVIELVDGWGIDVLIPMTDASIITLVPRCRNRSGLAVPMPDMETMERASDKSVASREAEQMGIPVPRREMVQEPTTDLRELLDSLDFPLVVKTSRSVPTARGGTRRFTVRHASDETELGEALSEFPRSAYPLLVEEHISGSGLGVFLLRWDNEVIAEFAHRRLREKPPSGGVSVLRESITPDPDLLDRSKQLLDRFEWQGVAMIEYRVEAGTGTPYFMEINGRFWGSLQLAVDGGVDFPALLLEAVTDPETPRSRPTGYESGVKCRWFWGDVDHLLLVLRHSDLYSSGERKRGRMRAIGDFIRGFGPAVNDEVFRFEDPKPFAVESIQWLRSALSRGDTAER